MTYAQPGQEGSVVSFKSRFDNFIGGEWVAPADGRYFENVTPVTGQVYCEVARSSAADIEKALDAAHAARASWGATSVADRSNLLLKIADRVEQNLEMLAVAETWENGKAVRETLNADLPLFVDHFRYFAGCIRAQEGSAAELDATTASYHFHEPYGVVGQIIPWNFPLLMAAWKLAPALAAGNCVVMKPAEQTPVTILLVMELIQDILPAGVVNIVNGFGAEAGAALSQSTRIAKLASPARRRWVMRFSSARRTTSFLQRLSWVVSHRISTLRMFWTMKMTTLTSVRRVCCWASSTRVKCVPVPPGR